jgi:hypothetical protein
MYWLGAQFREAACEVLFCANMILAGKGKMPTLPTHRQDLFPTSGTRRGVDGWASEALSRSRNWPSI